MDAKSRAFLVRPHQRRTTRHIGDDDCDEAPDLARIASPVVNFRFENAFCGSIGASD
jgi:hypothetical protein